MEFVKVKTPKKTKLIACNNMQQAKNLADNLNVLQLIINKLTA